MRVLAFLVALAVAVSAATEGTPYASHPVPILAKRNCKVMPSRPDPKIRDQIYLVALRMNVTDKVMLAMMATAIVESLVNNLDCGDQDSVGVFQQRWSKGWGTIKQIMDPDYSTRKFLERCIPLDRQFPNIDAGSLAMKVQLAEAGNKYTGVLPLARQYLELARKSTGKSGPQPTATTAPRPTSDPTSTTTKTTTKTTSGSSTAQPEPTPTAVEAKFPEMPVHTLWIPGVDGGQPRVLQKVLMPSALVARVDPTLDGGETSSDRRKAAECARAEYARPGDSCMTFVARYGLKVDALRALNPSIDSECLNLDVHMAWCVEAAEK